MDEAGTGHRLDGGRDLLAVPPDMGGERAERIGVGPDGGHLDRLTVLIERVHIEPLA